MEGGSPVGASARNPPAPQPIGGFLRLWRLTSLVNFHARFLRSPLTNPAPSVTIQSGCFKVKGTRASYALGPVLHELPLTS